MAEDLIPPESEKLLSSSEVAEALVSRYPQVIDNYPIYLISGSLAIKLALQADKIELLKVNKESSSSTPSLEVISELERDAVDDFSILATSPPKDIDYIQANAGFYDGKTQTSWDKQVFKHCPTTFFREWRNLADKEYLIECFQPSEVFPITHPLYKNWARVWVNGKFYFTINPAVVVTLRQTEAAVGKGKVEGLEREKTVAYKNALNKRFHKLYQRSST